MDKRYKHLNGEERGVILAEYRRGVSFGAIGLLLGCRASTIARELLRGRPEEDPAQPYCAQRGGDRYRARRRRCGRQRKLVAGGWLRDFVRSKLIHKRWSPEQIACRRSRVWRACLTAAVWKLGDCASACMAFTPSKAASFGHARPASVGAVAGNSRLRSQIGSAPARFPA
jgi:hypothetical protein